MPKSTNVADLIIVGDIFNQILTRK